MATSTTAGTSPALDAAFVKLEPLNANEYFTGFGADGRFLHGFPSGYGYANLPEDLVDELLSGAVRKVMWATFGDHPDSYVVLYEVRKSDGKFHTDMMVGVQTPDRAWSVLELGWNGADMIEPGLRVQLGSHGSFLVWSNHWWVAHGIPEPLRLLLKGVSLDDLQPWKGVFKHAGLGIPTIHHVAWHCTGSYYLTATASYQDLDAGSRMTYQQHYYNWVTPLLRQGWKDLWRNSPQGPGTSIAELAHAAINPHSRSGEDFIFIMKQQGSEEPNFVVHLEPDEMFFRLTSAPKTTHRANTGKTRVDALSIEPRPKRPHRYRWAKAKRSGRFHKYDTWELDLKQNEKVMVILEQGDVWCVVENLKGVKGWVPRDFLDFKMQPQTPADAYEAWTEKATELFKGANATHFPDPFFFYNVCRLPACQTNKDEASALRTCVHDLEQLLRGSQRYSIGYLKEERIRWHPDKIARFCHPFHREMLKKQSSGLFVLIGVLLDHVKAGTRPT